MIWDSEQIVEEKTITVTIVDITFNTGSGWSYPTNYQLKFSDGTWILTGSISTVESSLKRGHAYKLSLMKKRGYADWFITNVTEIPTS